jgi:hypothetical protein
MAHYQQRKDGEGFTVPSGKIYRLACCECGLVHDFVFISQDGKPIGVAAKRNPRATAQRRRKRRGNGVAQMIADALNPPDEGESWKD